MSDPTDHTLLICSACRGQEQAETLSRALLAELPTGFVIRTISCMAGCSAPMTVGFQAPGKAQYLFDQIDTEDDIAALVAFAHQYQHLDDGWCNATDRPAALIDKTRARMPAMASGVAE